MGRKAKIKQEKKSFEPSITPIEDSNNPNSYIKQMQKQGYSLKTIERSPELPEKKIEPEI